MKKLPENFELHRYGIDVRLVREEDAEFILTLRTDEKLSRYLHKTENDLEKQLEWMRQYKIRELKGLDYYLVYSSHGQVFGVSRIYDINENSATGGSWLCKPNTEVENALATLLISRDIIFEELGLEFDVFDVRKKNRQVQRTHQMLGAIKIGETDLDYLYKLSKVDYLISREKIIKLLDL